MHTPEAIAPARDACEIVGMDGFSDDREARATLGYYSRWGDTPSRAASDRIAIPDGANVEMVATLFASLIAECRPERYARCSPETRQLAADTARLLAQTYERYLWSRLTPSGPSGTTASRGELDVEAALTLARMMMTQRRLSEAAQVYGQLANALRTRSDYLALAHYARGRHLLDTGARSEARLELTRALTLDPTLAEAQAALDSMQTRELRKL
ncbi:MAG TPA: hypothetical protein VGM88_04230 [Kofleriaceae bacterium]|jgi:tetratricopeptide (TPR) repeat protein